MKFTPRQLEGLLDYIFPQTRIKPARCGLNLQFTPRRTKPAARLCPTPQVSAVTDVHSRAGTVCTWRWQRLALTRYRWPRQCAPDLSDLGKISRGVTAGGVGCSRQLSGIISHLLPPNARLSSYSNKPFLSTQPPGAPEEPHYCLQRGHEPPPGWLHKVWTSGRHSIQN